MMSLFNPIRVIVWIDLLHIIIFDNLEKKKNCIIIAKQYFLLLLFVCHLASFDEILRLDDIASYADSDWRIYISSKSHPTPVYK